ncbi:hypothetical protein MMC34_008510 [Xylographa carneopallida]|nr:hypothetical protein [Xylographa carneopallida]
MESLLSAPQLDSLLQLLASPRPLHLVSDAFHSSFDRTQRYRAALATLALLQEAEAPPATHVKPPDAAAEEKQQLDSAPRSSPRQPGTPSASSSLLSLSAVLRPSQRLAALFVLYDFSRPDVSLPDDGSIDLQAAQAMLLANPFLDTLLSHLDTLDALSHSNTTAAAASSLPSTTSSFLQCERQLVVRLLLHQQVASLRQRTAKEVLDAFKPDRFSTQPAHKLALSTQPPSELATALAPLRAYVTARQLKPPPAVVAEWMSLVKGSGGGEGVVLDAPITPQSARSSASTSSPASFLDDRSSSPFLNSSGSATASASLLSLEAVLDLLQRAVKSHLSSSDRHALSSTFAASAAIVSQVTQPPNQLFPQQLPALVDKNPSVATALLLALLTSTSTAPNTASAYLSALLQCELSLHSMEVVSRLSSQQPAALSSDFLVQYCHRGMEGCRAIADRYGQSRMVRLLCVFCQSLLRERDGSGSGLYVLLNEMMGFCVEFSKVKEATQLYRTLKEWEAENG